MQSIKYVRTYMLTIYVLRIYVCMCTGTYYILIVEVPNSDRRWMSLGPEGFEARRLQQLPLEEPPPHRGREQRVRRQAQQEAEERPLQVMSSEVSVTRFGKILSHW